MANTAKLNEFVLISRVESGTFVVVYGPRDNDRIRHFRGGFATAEDAVAWVEALDRLVANAPSWSAPRKTTRQAAAQAQA